MSKIDNRINPAAPHNEKIMVSTDRTFCHVDVFRASRPECRKYRSEMKEMSKTTTVTALMAMNMGFRSVAPTSEMYLIFVRMWFQIVNNRDTESTYAIF